MRTGFGDTLFGTSTKSTRRCYWQVFGQGVVIFLMYVCRVSAFRFVDPIRFNEDL